MPEENVSDRKYKSLLNINVYLKQMVLYLEHKNTKEDFLKSEKARISDIIKNKLTQYEYWSANVCDKNVEVKKRRSIFDKEIGLNKLKKQLKTINYLLN